MSEEDPPVSRLAFMKAAAMYLPNDDNVTCSDLAIRGPHFEGQIAFSGRFKDEGESSGF